MAAKGNPAPPVRARVFPSVAAWGAWLKKNHASLPGVWLRLTKKSAGRGHIEYGEVLDVALGHGWIDGQRRSCDERTFLQRFTPRTPRSIWSTINRDRAMMLMKAGRMHPSGLAEIERARRDGPWKAAYDSFSTARVPPDLAAALKANSRAAAAFAGLDSRNRYAILFRTQTAKRPETRARRIEQFVAMLARGERIYP